MIVCKQCNEEKLESEFYYRKDNNKYRKVCKICWAFKSSKYKNDNIDKIKQYLNSNSEHIAKQRRVYYDSKRDDILFYTKEYYEKHRDELINYSKQYRKANNLKIKEFNKEYKEKHKAELKIKQQKYLNDNIEIVRDTRRRCANNRRRVNPLIKLRHSISCLVRHNLKLGNKNGSIVKFLPSSIEEMRHHIQNQFEPWMNWSNWGGYDLKTWNDNDQSTWTWQIDHIIPQSDLPYTSMEDQNFRKCWSLENLRPLNAKQNLLEGVHRTRHTKKG